jgi:hypothetical protein
MKTFKEFNHVVSGVDSDKYITVRISCRDENLIAEATVDGEFAGSLVIPKYPTSLLMARTIVQQFL